MEKNELSFEYETKSTAIGKFILFLLLGVFLCIGIVLLGVGILSLGTDGDLLVALKFILPGTTSFLFGMLGFLYSKLSSRTKIVRSYFDTVNNRYYLETKKGESGYISFGEINSLAMRKEVVSGDNSSTTYYVIYIIKKDGAWWDVVSFESEIAALKKLNELQEKVKFGTDGDFNILKEETPSKLFTFKETSNGFLFQWGEQVSFLYRVLGILAVISFLSTFGILSSLMNEFGTVGHYILIGFLSIFGILVLYGIFRSIFGYKNYELELTKEKITFMGVKKEKKKILAEVPTTEIKFTQYSYNMYHGDIFNGQEIYLLNQEFSDKLAKYKNGDFGMTEVFSLMKDIMHIKKSIIKLPFPGFKSLDIILFEQKLDEELRKLNPETK